MTAMSRPSPAVVLGVSLLGISFAAPLVRVSAAHPVAIATWRLGFSLIIIAVALGISGQWRQLRRLGARDVAVASGAGLMLALHFWSWNTSVGLTTVAASVDTLLTAVSSNNGTVGQLLSDTTLYRNLVGITQSSDSLLKLLTKGEGAAAKMLRDPVLYDNLLKMTTDLNALIEDFRKNPRKYIKFF